ncbi:MAG TPA: hypothetical protein VK656_00700 [Candidatus Acidoferrum sp.]|nr:hypothetical protein [Candidatus Acidoferrum sp.]
MTLTVRSEHETADQLLDGLELVVRRRLLVSGTVASIPLNVGDRILVRVGDAVEAGTPLIERMRDVVLVEAVPSGRRRGASPMSDGAAYGSESGSWYAAAGGDAGELVARVAGTWRIARGTPSDVLDAPVDGVVTRIRPGVALELAAGGPALPGVFVAGGPARGRLEIASGPEGELRPAAIDVGRAGSILVVGSRVDAETLIRARAMGVRGVIVAGLSEKDVRDLAASDSRQQAGFHAPAPFAVLVLDGALRRPIAGPVMAVLAACAGRDVAIVADPPALLLGPGSPVPATVDPGFVRVAHGPLAGREGTWRGLAGPRRFRAGILLDAGLVAFGDEPVIAVPLADLERYA